EAEDDGDDQDPADFWGSVAVCLRHHVQTGADEKGHRKSEGEQPEHFEGTSPRAIIGGCWKMTGWRIGVLRESFAERGSLRGKYLQCATLGTCQSGIPLPKILRSSTHSLSLSIW